MAIRPACIAPYRMLQSVIVSSGAVKPAFSRGEDTAMREACLAFALVAAFAAARPVQSQAWPQQPVRIVVPYAAGGNTDAIARIIAPRLAEVFGQQFVV